MSAKRKIIAGLILGVFILASLVWIFYLPFTPERLYGAIPDNAAWISVHYRLGSRWPALSTNALTKALMTHFSANGSLPANPSMKFRQEQRWLKRLTAQETAFAYVPSLGPSGAPAWVGISWIGADSHILRWSLFWRRFSQIRRLGNFGGRTIWSLPEPLGRSGLRLSLAVGEGLVFACLSPDPAAVRFILRDYDGPAKSAAQRYCASRPDATIPDRGWINMSLSADKLPQPVTLAYTMPAATANTRQFQLQSDPPLPALPPLTATVDLAAVGPRLGDLPAILLLVPGALVSDAMTVRNAPFWSKVVGRTLQADTFTANTNSLILALFTGDYSGGFGREPFRMKIPALMTFIKVRKPDALRATLNQMLDAINAKYRLGLILDPTPMPVGKQSLFTLEATGNNALAILAFEDRPAFTLIGDWLIFSSNARSLAKLLDHFKEVDLQKPGGPSAWQQQIETRSPAALLWINLDSGGKALELALSAWSLNLRSAPSTDTDAALPFINFAKAFLETRAPVQRACFWLEAATSAPALRLEIGPAPGAGP